MNILVPHNWLLEYVKTEATPDQIAAELSLRALSVESIQYIEGEPVYEIEVTPNRGDCLSVKGVAREAAAVLGRIGVRAEFCDAGSSSVFNDNGLPELDLKVDIQQPSLCPRFTAAMVDNVVIGPSPALIQKRLIQVGSRPINNIIDITNYLMFDRGQPMHAFDYDRIGGYCMILRQSKKGERITTLDNQERVLPKGAIVIEDGEGRLIDLCGIMGGYNSAVDENTRRVLFFVQVYDPKKIRQTTMVLGHRTEAAARFEKGIDLAGVSSGLAQAVLMAQESAAAKLSAKVLDIGERETKKVCVAINYSLINRVLGKKMAVEEVNSILADLGFKIEGKKALAPSWRRGDVNAPEDLVEEVARLYGYSNLDSVVPAALAGIDQDPVFYWEDQLKNVLQALGYVETYSSSAVSSELLNRCALDLSQVLKIKNPLVQDNEYLRISLLPQLIQSAAQNLTHPLPIKLFETSAVYLSSFSDEIPEQPQKLGLVCASQSENLFNLVKGEIESILYSMGIHSWEWRGASDSSLVVFDKGATAELRLKNSDGDDFTVGFLGFACAEVIHNFDFNCPLLLGEFSLGRITDMSCRNFSYVPENKYPSVKEDLSVVATGNLPVGDLVSLVEAVADDVLIKAEVSNIYVTKTPQGLSRSVLISYNVSSSLGTVSPQKMLELRNRAIASLELVEGVSVKRKE